MVTPPKAERPDIIGTSFHQAENQLSGKMSELLPVVAILPNVRVEAAKFGLAD
jgi:hypothetical protein